MFQLVGATETTKSHPFNFQETEVQRRKKNNICQEPARSCVSFFSSLCAPCCLTFQQYHEMALVPPHFTDEETKAQAD